MSFLPYPYSNCIEKVNDETVYKRYAWHIKNNTLSYSPEICVQVCAADILKENQTWSGNQFDWKTFWEKCLKFCPNECYSRGYDYMMDYSIFPTKYYFNNLNDTSIDKSLGYSLLRNSILRLTFRFKDLSLQVVKHYPKIGPNQITSNIGGTLGCFLGASLISLMEIMEIFGCLLKIITVKIFIKLKTIFSRI